ncbi:MAG: hypothetical protein C0507_17165 [Cyanobacteria bacterium PR.3.49]|nr:hypothetical protein [Cyanobacteria bacterium PR.3.49]
MLLTVDILAELILLVLKPGTLASAQSIACRAIKTLLPVKRCLLSVQTCRFTACQRAVINTVVDARMLSCLSSVDAITPIACLGWLQVQDYRASHKSER